MRKIYNFLDSWKGALYGLMFGYSISMIATSETAGQTQDGAFILVVSSLLSLHYFMEPHCKRS